MVIFGLLLALLFVGGSAYLAGKAIHSAHEAGKLAATPKKGTKKTRAKVTARNAPHNVRTIFAQAYADNWVAHREHLRQTRAAAPAAPATPAAPKPQRSVLRRLIAPAGSPQATAPQAVPGPPTASTNGHRPSATIPQTPAPAATPRPGRPNLVPVPSPTNGRPAPMTTAPPSAAPTGAAADMFGAANTLNSHARAGGIHGKLRGERVYTEALGFIATALEQFAKDMQDTGRYPAMAWEPVITAAAHVRAGALSMGEAANALTRLGNMTLLENAGSAVQAPHHDELNRA